jgi:hypothetical protein
MLGALQLIDELHGFSPIKRDGDEIALVGGSWARPATRTSPPALEGPPDLRVGELQRRVTDAGTEHADAVALDASLNV